MRSEKETVNKTITIEAVLRESDKAYHAQCEIESGAGRKGVKIWLPKSQVKMSEDKRSCKVPEWLLKTKLEEMFGVERSGSFWFN
jgi:hypothetical protein